MLVITRRPNEAIMVEDKVEIVVLGVKGRQVRLGIRAPKEIQVHRKEVYERKAGMITAQETEEVEDV
ncbi:MAG: carbon storage regulator CsrA [Gammaproteobacteria bacterium]